MIEIALFIKCGGVKTNILKRVFFDLNVEACICINKYFKARFLLKCGGVKTNILNRIFIQMWRRGSK